MEQPLSLAETTGGQEEQADDEGRDALQASTLLKLAFSEKLPLVTLQSSPFWADANYHDWIKANSFLSLVGKAHKIPIVFQNCIREPFLQYM